MKTRSSSSASTFAVTAILLLCGAKAPSEVPKIDFCKVRTAPALYRGKMIEVRAQFFTDYIERSGIFDPSCDDRREFGIGGKSPDKAFRPIEQYLGRIIGQPTYTVTANFVGKVTREKRNRFLYGDNDDGYRFDVRAISKVVAKSNGIWGRPKVGNP